MDAVQYAYDAVAERLQSGYWSQGKRLPSLAELALQCGVSRTTIWRALGRLQNDSLVHLRGKAIFAGPCSNPDPSIRNAGSASSRLIRQIGRSIFVGDFPQEGLPPLYKAARQYGIAINTLKKALGGLVEAGLLVKQGRRYQPAPHRSRLHHQEMVLISEGQSEQSLSIAVYRTEQVVAEFERESLRLGYVPRCLGFNRRDPKGVGRISNALNKMTDIAGCIVNVWNPWSETEWHRWLDLLHRIADRGVPVVVVDQEGDLRFPESLIGKRNFRVVQISGIRAGELVAAALLKRGHRRVTYVTPFFGLSWARKRYEGLSRYYRQFGPPGSAVKLYGQSAVMPNNLTLSIMGLGRQDLARLFSERYSAEQLRGLADEFESAQQLRLPERLRQIPEAGTVRRLARFLSGLVRQPHNRASFDAMLESLIHVASNAAQQWHLQTFLERLVVHNDSTAWVCSDIKPALAATLLLQKRGVRVPGDVSVIGFENVHESYEYQISTFEFDMRAMVQQALRIIVDEKFLKSKPAVSEVDGYVVERRTTRR